MSEYVLDHKALPVGVGSANIGLVVHHFGRWGRVFLRIVEKRTARIHEGTFYLQAYSILEGSRLNVPRLFHASQLGDKRYIIMTEEIEGAMKRPHLCHKKGYALGSYLAEICLLGLPCSRVHTFARSLQPKDVLLLEQGFESDEEKRACKIIIRNFDRIEKRVSALPDVTCHNDLNWNNMAIPSNVHSAAPYLFDWGSVGMNCLGADLHFFAEHYLTKEEWSVGMAIFEGYADRVNATKGWANAWGVGDLILSAFFFGLGVRANWVQNIDRARHLASAGRMCRSFARCLESGV
ncbi:phosphotransferase [Wenzhouxiangella sp. AB-CW3]|uniref:phosphotransferase family protein n=1 Tax=Wenzhouxiangella sp. AB-CW3 TaxID=2771012 RepID=UPI00168AB18C|nr:phosphotransferase [Wenzhouxiangella sp. AB-CW3]QOC23785.1 phosphotransferase [Wenzhouxiangella sp. AB-CW3]